MARSHLLKALKPARVGRHGRSHSKSHSHPVGEQLRQQDPHAHAHPRLTSQPLT